MCRAKPNCSDRFNAWAMPIVMARARSVVYTGIRARLHNSMLKSNAPFALSLDTAPGYHKKKLNLAKEQLNTI